MLLDDINSSKSNKNIENEIKDKYGITIKINNKYQILDSKENFFRIGMKTSNGTVKWVSIFKGSESDWDDIEVIEWNGQSLIQVGYKNTGNRTMAVATKDQFIYSAEWASIQAFKYGTIQEPDIDLSTWELNYPYVENGNSYSLFVEIMNIFSCPRLELFSFVFI